MRFAHLEFPDTCRPENTTHRRFDMGPAIEDLEASASGFFKKTSWTPQVRGRLVVVCARAKEIKYCRRGQRAAWALKEPRAPQGEAGKRTIALFPKLSARP